MQRPQTAEKLPTGECQLHGKEGLPTDSELLVASAWSDVLGYAEFQADDNFFDIGGNSIMILKVHAFLDKDRPGIVQLPDLFAFPTIVKLAGYQLSTRSGTAAFDIYQPIPLCIRNANKSGS